jgi:hypothetical protein
LDDFRISGQAAAAAKELRDFLEYANKANEATIDKFQASADNHE